MIIFVDTEYTSPVDLGLISVGLVSEDGRRDFYAELAPHLNMCNSFVRKNVIPVLSGPVVTEPELRRTIRDWFDRMPRRIVLAADSVTDIRLLMNMLEARPVNIEPDWIDLKPFIDTTVFHSAVCKYHEQQERPWHHALHDARAHRAGWLAVRAQAAKGLTPLARHQKAEASC